MNVIIDAISAGDIQKMIDDAKTKYDKVAILLMQNNNGKYGNHTIVLY